MASTFMGKMRYQPDSWPSSFKPTLYQLEPEPYGPFPTSRRVADVGDMRAFGAKLADESHRARLRVEIGRLRRALRTLARVSATRRGFVLAPRRAREVVVLARPVDEEHAAVLAFLAGGESWSSSGLALAHRAAGARRARGRRQGAVDPPRASSSVDDPTRARIHDDLVLPAPLPTD